MLISHNWLQKYFDGKLPGPNKLAEFLNTHSFEVEEVKGDILDIDVLPNRAHDCLSHYGMAKEVSAITGLELKEITKEPPNGSGDPIAVKVEDEKLCRRYIAVFVRGVKVGPSPDWLRESLESVDQKSINNIVDATNYVMWSFGQPLHAFDADKLDGNTIHIRRARNEKITTLDGKEVELSEDNLVIADDKDVLAIAGVKGGNKAEVGENTTNIVLESANFDPVSVRKTSRHLAILTDSSKRFENEITPELAEVGMNEVVSLISEIAGGNFSEKTDIYPRKPNFYKVGFSVEETNRLLGMNLSEKDIEDILNRFGFEFVKVNPLQKVLELAPTFVGVPYKSGASVVYDAPNEFDCSSFVSHLFVQAGIAIPRISVDQYIFGNPVSKSDLKAGDLIFANTGLVIKTGIYKKTIEFLPGTEVPEGVDHVGLYLGDGKVIYTGSQTEKVVIEDLINAKMFQNIVGYRRIINKDTNRFVVTIPHERLDLRIKQDLIEEIGRIYGYKNIESVVPEKIVEPKINKIFYYTNKVRKILTDLGFNEVYTYTFGDMGEVEVEKPLASNLTHLRTNLTKGIQKSLELNMKNAPLLGLDEIKIFEIGKVFPSINGEYISLCIGTTGKFDEMKELSDFGIELPKDGIVEINFSELVEKLPDVDDYDDVLITGDDSGIRYQTISSYPFMLRDIAVFAPRDKNEDDVLSVIKENAGDLLVQTKLFDVYKKDDRTSYAFNLVFQSQEKTLTDEEVNGVMEGVEKGVNDMGWEVR